MSYEVLRTDTADEQIHDIAMYIAKVAGTKAALHFVDKVEEAAERLAEFPKIGTIPRWGMLAKRGYRVLTVGDYVMLYTVDDTKQRVIVDAVVYGRREYWKLV